MTRLSVGRVGWLVRIVLLAGILFLAARIELAPWTVRDSSIRGGLSAPVTCVLPATADDPSPTSGSVSETTGPDCETSMRDYLRTAWMTAC